VAHTHSFAHENNEWQHPDPAAITERGGGAKN
jgi:hypothetical protein